MLTNKLKAVQDNKSRFNVFIGLTGKLFSNYHESKLSKTSLALLI